jgi:hypothetical protein
MLLTFLVLVGAAGTLPRLHDRQLCSKIQCIQGANRIKLTTNKLNSQVWAAIIDLN